LNGALNPGVGAELTIVLPGLAGPDVPGGERGAADALQAASALTEAVHLPGLTALLEFARDEHDAFASPTADGLLAEAFNIPRDADGQWCAAAVARQGASGDARDRHWMRADPVHLHADMGRLIVFPPVMLGLDCAESRAICEWMNGHEHFPGPALDAVSGTCWLIEVDARASRMRTFAPSVVHGEDADRFLPAGEDAPRWHARMNEMQMLLNQCPLNQARAARGEPVVNSVWFWGAGALPLPSLWPLPGSAGSPYTQVHGDHDLLAGLADCVGLRARALPDDGAQWLRDAPAQGAQLLVLDDMQLAACAADVGAWQLALHTLDERWLQPIATALRRGVWQRITLHAGGGASVVIHRPGPLRWLRRRRGLADALSRLRQVRSQGGTRPADDAKLDPEIQAHSPVADT